MRSQLLSRSDPVQETTSLSSSQRKPGHLTRIRRIELSARSAPIRQNDPQPRRSVRRLRSAPSYVRIIRYRPPSLGSNLVISAFIPDGGNQEAKRSGSRNAWYRASGDAVITREAESTLRPLGPIVIATPPSRRGATVAPLNAQSCICPTLLFGHAGKYRPEVCSPQRCNDFWGKLTRKADGEPLRQLGNLPQPIDASSPDLALVGDKLPSIQRGTVAS